MFIEWNNLGDIENFEGKISNNFSLTDQIRYKQVQALLTPTPKTAPVGIVV